MAKVGEAWVAVHPNADGFFVELTKQMADERAKSDPDDTEYKHQVKPEIDREAWRKAKGEWQKENDKDVAAGKGPSVRVRVTPDDSEEGKRNFQKDLDRLAKSMRRKDQAVRVKVQADTKQARLDIKRLGEERVRVGVEYYDVDKAEDLAKRQVQQEKMAQALHNERLRQQSNRQRAAAKDGNLDMHVRFRTDENALDDIREAVRDVLRMAEHDNDFKLKIGVDTGEIVNLDEHLKSLDALEKRLGGLSDKTKLKVEVDPESAAGLDTFFADNYFEWKDAGHWEQSVWLRPSVDADVDPFTDMFGENGITWDNDGWYGDVKLRVKPEFDADKSDFGKQLDELSKFFAKQDVKVRADVDVDGAAAEAKLDHIARDRTVKIDVDVLGDGLDDLIDRLDQAQDAIDKLGAEWGEDFTTGVDVHVDVDGETAEAQLDYLTRDRTVHIRTVIDGNEDVRGIFQRVERGVVQVESDAATSRDVNRASAQITEAIDASVAKVAKKLDLPGARRHEGEISQLKIASDMVKAQLGMLSEGENKFRPTLGELSAEYIKEQIARQDREARAGVGPRIERMIRAYSQQVAQEIAPAAETIADEVRKIRKGATARVTRPRAIADRFDTDGLSNSVHLIESIEKGVQANARWSEKVARELEEAPNARDFARVLKGVDRALRKPAISEHAAWLNARPTLARLDAAVSAEELALGKLGGASLSNALKGELSDVVRNRADAVAAAQAGQRQAELELRKIYSRVPGYGDEGRLGRQLDTLLYQLRGRHNEPVQVKIAADTPALDAAKKWFEENRNLSGIVDSGRQLGPHVMSRAESKEAGSFADTWVNAVKKATVTRDRDSDFTFYLKKGMQHTLSAPAHLARMFGGARQKPRGVGMLGATNIVDASGIIDLGPAVARGTKVGPEAMSKLPGAAKGPGGLGKFAGLPGLAAQGALTGLRISWMGGAVAAGVGVLTDAVAGLSAELVAITKPLGQVMLGIAAAPAALAQVATGVAAVALSMNNMGDAFKAIGDPEAFAQALEELTPSARELMTAINDMHEPFMQMREDMQEAMFDGAGDSFARMADNLFPVVSEKFPEMSAAIGDLGDTLMDTLASPQVARRVASTFDGMNKSFQEMQPGIASFTEGIVRMVDVGARTALPALGRAFSQFGDWFNNYFSEGRITSWINTAGEGLRELGGLGKDLWSGLGGFMSAMADGADASFGAGGVWGAMRQAIADFRDFANSDVGQAKIADFFKGATDSAREVWDIMKQWGGAIVDDVIPAARNFLKDHGDTIGNLGEDLLQISGKMITSLGPLVETIAAVVSGINEITGGPGSAKRNREIGDRAARGEKWLDENWSVDPDNFKRYDMRGREHVDQKGLDKRKEQLADFMSQQRAVLDENMASVDTEQWLRVADGIARANFQLQALEGGFQGAKQSADATASVMTMLGNKIVDIPDSKSIEIKADENDRAVNALKSLGAEVAALEDKPGHLRVEFENEMEIAGAIEKLQADMEGMDAAEISVRGLDQALDQAVQLKAQMDGMGDAEVAINVEAGQVDEVIAKLREMGIEAQNINGSVYLDTNAPEVQSFLEAINAGKEINGQFVLESNAEEELAKVLGLDGTEIHTFQTVTSNAGEVAAEKDLLAADTSSTDTVTSNAAEVKAQKDTLNEASASTDTVTSNVAEIKSQKDQLNQANASTHTVNSNVGGIVSQVASLARTVVTNHIIKTIGAIGKLTGNANGSVMPAENGFAKREAMHAPKGSYILWAENETEGESYIPHALSKRARSTQILSETATMFGLRVVDANGEPVLRDGSSVAPMANGGVKYGNPQARRLTELNKHRSRAEAYQRIEQQKLERERELKEKQRRKELTPAEKSEAARLEQEIAEVQARRKREEDGYARAMTGYKRGQFVYTDVDADHEEAVRSVDRAGLIPGKVRISSTIKDWDDVDERSLGIIPALDNDRFATEYEPQIRGRLNSMEQWAVGQGFDPGTVNSARRAVEAAMPLTDLPPEVQAALLSGEDVNRAERAHRDIDTEKLWKPKRSFDEINWNLIGKYLQGWYGDNLADQIGLNARIARDLPLYNMVNPDDDAWNAVLGDIRGGRRNIERQYKDKYQDERDVMRKAQSDERDRQKARDAAEKKARQNPDQLRKSLERELAKERDDNAARAAGMNAVREHRAAMAQQQHGQGVVVNQTIGNITAADASEAAAKFRRKTMVGFENLTGVF